MLTGMFMEYAEGKEGAYLLSRRQNDPRFASPSYLESGTLKRQIADLQILDCACGQIDRHLHNIMFQTDPRTGALTGLKGIDNDLAFGLETKTKSKCYHSIPLGLIRTVSQETANALESLDKEVIDYHMRDLLDPEERNALWERIDTLRSDHVKKVPQGAWDQEPWDSLIIGNQQKAGTAPCQNLFYKIYAAAAGSFNLPSACKKSVQPMIQEGNSFISSRNRQAGQNPRTNQRQDLPPAAVKKPSVRGR